MKTEICPNCTTKVVFTADDNCPACRVKRGTIISPVPKETPEPSRLAGWLTPLIQRAESGDLFLLDNPVVGFVRIFAYSPLLWFTAHLFIALHEYIFGATPNDPNFLVGIVLLAWFLFLFVLSILVVMAIDFGIVATATLISLAIPSKHGDDREDVRVCLTVPAAVFAVIFLIFTFDGWRRSLNAVNTSVAEVHSTEDGAI